MLNRLNPRHALRLAALAILLPLAGTAAAQNVINISSWVPPSHHINTTIKAWCSEVEQGTANRVKCNMLAKPVAPPHQSLNAVRQGLADASFTVVAYNAEPMPTGMLLSVPFAMGPNANGERVSAALWTVLRPHLAQSGEWKGVKMLSTGAGSPNHMYSTAKPLRTAADFKGLKVLVGAKLGADIVTAFGGQPVVKPASDLYQMFSGGIVDASFNPIETVKSFKIDPFVKHATLVPGGMWMGFGSFYISDAKWNSLSREDQAVVERASGDRLSRRWGSAFDAEDRDAIELMKKGGTQIVTASDELMRQMATASAGIGREMIAAAREKGVADPEKVLQQLRAEVDRVAKP
ncbi:MAG: Lactate-binding periplasmic protein precursor [Ramlibacter sp.]|jgi:TRAP-type C4-dicarboxylate transport system substrate-binding protein|nr:Lactate-binding periplasmic protein precursor [Ramlibacter sp.]